ncbi:ABC transporter permease [Paracoccus sp. 1_MG-2023]|uniref:ABC transporter permease n=1 Tax=unclassified Paracoccus (in: a-proteobacteria) TaxID=2688777 RepID=UPI001C0A6253|nr:MULTISPECIES: ABC transporter permease [unclassified Paracoccus (in: a-proteobacteria)]MBU2956219.1 ABC transporter permease [Paracoccus sp. C2R09]MDO6667896.1 ABC transporter permease [Paracoccus sp. 1_MG-2023]
MIPHVDRPGILFALVGGAGLALPLVQFKANRIVAGEGLGMPAALPWGWFAVAAIAALLLAGLFRMGAALRLAMAVAGLALVVAALGAAAQALTPPDDTLARVAPSAGFWLLGLAMALMGADALTRLRPSLPLRWLLLGAAVMAVAGVLGSGMLDGISVMREYAARQDMFLREASTHLLLAFGSLTAALLAGLPIGIAIHQRPGLRRPVLSGLNVLQTIPSLALFGIMIPIFGWIAATWPAAANAGVSGIGIFPALVALFLYSLLPVVANTLTGLSGVDPAAVEAARGLGMTRPQLMTRVLVPLALPVLLAAIRIVLVQNIGLAVIAGLIGGGGFGTFVFQGLNQTAMDLVLLGALPTIALALVAGIAMDLAVEASRKGAA